MYSQIGIGTASPVSSAALDITSSNKGLLKPRMTTAQRTAIATPATSLEVYDTTTNTTWYYNGTSWVNAGSPTTTVSNASTANNLTTTVNGVFATAVPMVNSVANTVSGNTVSTSVNGFAGTAVTVPNIYTANGTLSGNRTVTQGGNTLAFTSTATNGFSVDGTTFSVDGANNRLGIGTAAPTQALDVMGNVRFSGALMPDNNAGTSGQILESRGPSVPPVFVNNSVSSSQTFTLSNVLVGGVNARTFTPSGASSFYKVLVYTNNSCGYTFFDEYIVAGGNSNAAWRISAVAGVGTSNTGNPDTVFTRIDSQQIQSTRLMDGCADGGGSTAFNYTIQKSSGTDNIIITNNGNITRTYTVKIISY